MAINTYFKNIADAIREKTGGSAFITPGQMPGEIRSIITGSDANIQALHRDINTGWYIGTEGDFYRKSDPATWHNYRMDMYPISADHNYIIGLGAIAGARFRASRTNVDLYTNPDTASPLQGSNVYYNDSPAPYLYYYFRSYSNTYLYIYKSSTAQDNIKTFVFDMDKI